MLNKTLELRRNRTVKAEIYEDGCIGLEVAKNGVKPGYKNGESDYHETYFNLTYDELDSLVEFLMNIMAISTEGGLVIDIDERVLTNA